MTKEEILAKVQATIAGQGNEVDLGGALPAILEAIVGLIPEGGSGNEPLIVPGTISVSTGMVVVSEEDLQKITDAYNRGTNVIIEIGGDGFTLTVCGFDGRFYFCVFGDGTGQDSPIYKYIITTEIP